MDNLIEENYSMEIAQNYFEKQLQGFKSATQLGAKLIIIRYLNTGLPLENLIDMCCFDKSGPKLFDSKDFVKAICGSWVFVGPGIRENVQGIDKATNSPETVEEQFGNMMLDIGFMGRRTHRYIPKEEVIRICKEIFDDSEQLEKAIEIEHQAIVEMLKRVNYERKKLMNESVTDKRENHIYNLDQLIFWSEKHEINEVTIKDLIELKEGVYKSIATNEGLQKDNID